MLIESEKGRDCTLQNPWPGQDLVLQRNGQTTEKLTGERVQFKTTAGERVVVLPAAAARSAP